MDEKARSQRARKAAHARWAKHDPKEAMEEVRRGFQMKCLATVEDDAAERGEQISEEEAARRAESLRKAHMAGMTLRRWPKHD